MNTNTLRPIKNRVFRKDWHNVTRLIFTNAGGSVQIDIRPHPFFEDFSDCFVLLWDLWVAEENRRKGYATALMDDAEQTALALGYDHIALEWCVQDTPVDILRWYERRGYEQRAFTPGQYAMLIKKLK